MKYAVVILARNEEKCIEKALSALRKQIVEPDQNIVVDDGSMDRTSFIASEYVDVVVQLPDRGYGVASRHELANLLIESFGQAHLKPVYRAPREGDIRNSYAAIGKAEKMLGYKPRITVKEGVRMLLKKPCKM